MNKNLKEFNLDSNKLYIISNNSKICKEKQGIAQ